MHLLWITLFYVIGIYTAVMWARLIIDWAMVLAPRWRPKGLLLVLVDLVFRLTDPPLKLLRKWIRPLRVGNIALDLSWLVVLIALNLLCTTGIYMAVVSSR